MALVTMSILFIFFTLSNPYRINKVNTSILENTFNKSLLWWIEDRNKGDKGRHTKINE